MSTTHPRWAVIPTRGDRPFVLGHCLEAIAPQVDGIVVVDNSDVDAADSTWAIPPNLAEQVDHWVIIQDPQQPPNLSRLWNLGIRQAYAENAAYVAVLNDDAIVSDRWMDVVIHFMNRNHCTAGSFGGGGGGPLPGGGVVHREPGTTPLDQRMAGYAFVLYAEPELLADEQFQWWCGDNDLDMQARACDGTVVLAGDPVKHLFPDRSTMENPALSGRTGEDMRLFVEKWGFRPW